jgi:hypothetical protein
MSHTTLRAKKPYKPWKPRNLVPWELRNLYIYVHVKKLAAVWESLIGTRSRIGTSRMTVTEGPTKGLELPDLEELKGLEGPELEKSAMTGGSEGCGGAKRRLLRSEIREKRE